ncbi:iron-sulfur cluster assembly scaffold protein [Candidatus Woesearchaeota archaeon]|jgi:NifU-like protein involved in Fe-S cluster formation|nr:iron-sulfur cluster assembly scaffold protein [Candidatus Woesearchaeota archaeon]MBT6044601.1 iron-sulfur cluster assembly scaffold protein [Candidatus Woesearchaeota archaeon]
MTQLEVIGSENKDWFYTEKVKDHFFHPRNIFKTEQEVKEFNADGVGLVGSPACGDGMKMFIKVEDDKIKAIRWQTYGCGTAIASTSAYSVMLLEDGGLSIENALKIKPKDIADYLGGVPARKFHCSVLADKALREAVNDYFKKSGQEDRIVEGSAKIIDKILKITDHDIEHAVLEGAYDFEAVQRKTKVGIHDKACIPEVERLIVVYKEKYFGD